MIGPQPLGMWLATLRRRFGLRLALRRRGVGARGVRELPPDERDRLLASTDAVFIYLRERVRRKQRRKDERTPQQEQQQEHVANDQQPRQRKLIGQIVRPGRESLPLYEDQCRPINARSARVLGGVWRMR